MQLAAATVLLGLHFNALGAEVAAGALPAAHLFARRRRAERAVETLGVPLFGLRVPDREKIR
jgi:hypothetical protein